MKLHEIARNKSGRGTERVNVDTYNYDKLSLDVTYDYEAEDVTSHGDNSSFDERHPASVETVAVHTVKPVQDYDDDGEPTKTWPAGTNVTKLAHWHPKLDDEAVDKALDKALDRK